MRDMKTQRLDKILSHHGYGSRKDAKRILHQGLVLVNNMVCTNADAQISINDDTVTVEGRTLELRHHVYLMMNKPGNVVCSTKDGLHKTVLDILPSQYKVSFLGGDLHPVGRLDIDTEGLLLLTTDGELTHRLTSPKKHISKKYYARLADTVSDELQKKYIEECKKGFDVSREGNEEGFCALPSELEWIASDEAYLTIYEGKYHQVKRMFKTLGNEVVYLKRTAVGELKLDETLRTGECRELQPEEIQKIL